MIRVMWPQTKECQCPPEAGRGKAVEPPEGASPTDSLILLNEVDFNSVVLSHQVYSTLLQSPQQTNTPNQKRDHAYFLAPSPGPPHPQTT